MRPIYVTYKDTSIKSKETFFFMKTIHWIRTRGTQSAVLNPWWASNLFVWSPESFHVEGCISRIPRNLMMEFLEDFGQNTMKRDWKSIGLPSWIASWSSKIFFFFFFSLHSPHVPSCCRNVCKLAAAWASDRIGLGGWIWKIFIRSYNKFTCVHTIFFSFFFFFFTYLKSSTSIHVPTNVASPPKSPEPFFCSSVRPSKRLGRPGRTTSYDCEGERREVQDMRVEFKKNKK